MKFFRIITLRSEMSVIVFNKGQCYFTKSWSSRHFCRFQRSQFVLLFCFFYSLSKCQGLPLSAIQTIMQLGQFHNNGMKRGNNKTKKLICYSWHPPVDTAAAAAFTHIELLCLFSEKKGMCVARQKKEKTLCRLSQPLWKHFNY